MVKELPQWGGALGAPGLLAVDAVQVQVDQAGKAIQKVHPPWCHLCTEHNPFAQSQLCNE